MTTRTVLVLALALVGCSKDGPATETAGPVQCGPGTQLVDGRCVASETEPAGPAEAGATDKRDLVGEFEAMADKLCGCPDKACAEELSKKLSNWVEENSDAANDLGPDQQERAQKIGERLSKCMITLLSDGPAVDAAAVPEKQKEIAAKVFAMFEKVAAAMKTHADDCGKMASELNTIAAKNKAVIEEGKKIDAEKDENFRRWFDETYGEKLKTVMMDGIGEMMKKCGADEGVKSAMQALTGS